MVYVFLNKRKDKAKLLHWMGSGFVLYYKRLEQGTFQLQDYDVDQGCIPLSYTQLVLLIDGVSITNITRTKKRFELTNSAE